MSLRSSPLPPQDAPLPTTGVGPVRFGKYSLYERLGRGGMAEVWKARISGPAGFQRTLVVKRILPHLVEDPHFVDMFTAEARLSARLNHANIVQVFELGDVAGEYFLAMEYVRGRDLVSVMRALLSKGRPAPGLGAYVMRDVCRALAYAHQLSDDEGRPLKLIHRDVSPSNVMLSFDGAVKLLDFGIAKALSEANENKTQTGTLKGKFGYMAPEQVEGRPFDHRSDLFAAGIVLHETLTGRRLFKGMGDLQTIAMVREAKVEPPSFLNPDVPHELDRITLKALAKNADDRYADCEEMARELDQVAHQLAFGAEKLKAMMRELFGDEPPDTNAHGLPHGEGAAVRRRSKRVRTIALVAAGTLAVAAGAFVVLHGERRVVDAPVVVTPATPMPTLEVPVRVSSTPPNALVTVEGEAKPRGRTPLVMKLPRSEEARYLVLTLDGYQPTRLDVVPDTDSSNVHAALQAAPPPRVVRAEKTVRKPARKPEPPKVIKPRAPSPDLKRGDVVDPFAR